MQRLLTMACGAVAVCLAMAGCGGGGDDAPAISKTSAAATDATKKVQASASSGAQFTNNGWYWNPNEGGTGFVFEAQGGVAFVAFFLYSDVTGKPVWYAADGPVTANGNGSFSFSGDLKYYSGGQPVSSPTYVTPRNTSMGTVSIMLSGNSANVLLPGGRTIAATRYDFGGLGGTPTASQPEVGWYWNPNEGGRGYAIEVQNNKVFLAMFHYNDDGTPTWNVVDGDISSGTVTSPFQLFSGGQTLTSAFRPPNKHFDLGSFTISFRNRCAGQVQRAGAAVVSIRRFVFGDITPGTECHTVTDGIPDVAGVQAGPVQMQPGDSVFGNIDVGGDVDAYGIALVANVTYTFDLRGYSTDGGTLWDPVLALYDSQLFKVAEDDDGSGYVDSRIVFTPTVSGTYYLAARGYQSLVGSFLLSASGIASGLTAQPVPALSSYAGTLDGVLVGKAQGAFSLSITAQGTLTGNGQMSGYSIGSLQASGSIATGGVVNFSAYTPTGLISFVGFLGPQGDLSGTWSDANGAGGVFMAAKRGSPIAAPTL